MATRKQTRPPGNRVTQRKLIRFPKRADSPLAPRVNVTQDLLQRLVEELQLVEIESLEKLGVSRQEQSKSYRRAIENPRQGPRASIEVLERSLAIADLLSTWRRDKRYREPDGKPRMLVIKGRGATLETLARKFVPSMTVEDVVTAITRHGEARIHRKDRVALIGDGVVLAPKTAEMTLASLITRVRRVASTVLVNAAGAEGQSALGRFEREVNGVLSERGFNNYARNMRTQLQDLCDRAEAGLELADGKGRNGKTCGIGVFIFRDD